MGIKQTLTQADMDNIARSLYKIDALIDLIDIEQTVLEDKLRYVGGLNQQTKQNFNLMKKVVKGFVKKNDSQLMENDNTEKWGEFCDSLNVAVDKLLNKRLEFRMQEQEA